MIWVAVLVAGSSATAAADTLAGYGEFGYRSSRYRGDLGDEFGSSWLGWQLGGGLRIKQFAIGAALDFHTVESLDVARHGDSLYQFGFGPEAKLFVGPDVGTRGYVRLGYRRSWISGDTSVQRLCQDTGQCVAGFWWEEPSYSGNAVRLGVGIEYIPPGAIKQNFLAAFFLDAGYDIVSHDIIGQETTGGMINLAIGAVIGGGRLR